MYYETRQDVLNAIHAYFNEKFAEEFVLDKNGANELQAVYESDNYYFKVMTAFIQERVDADLTVPIETRLGDVLNGVDIQKGKRYLFGSRMIKRTSIDQIPLEYYVGELD